MTCVHGQLGPDSMATPGPTGSKAQEAQPDFNTQGTGLIGLAEPILTLGSEITVERHGR